MAPPNSPPETSSNLSPHNAEQMWQAVFKEFDKNPPPPVIPPPLTSPPPLPPTPETATHLQVYHTQSYTIICYLTVLTIYIILMEYVIHAHSLPINTSAQLGEVLSFGRQGTPRRSAVVQGFAVARTILAVAHIPIVTGALAATIPPLTQKVKGRTPPGLTATQLFMLADRSWSGPTGWVKGMRVGGLPW